jgi:hypothetical protein
MSTAKASALLLLTVVACGPSGPTTRTRPATGAPDASPGPEASAPAPASNVAAPLTPDAAPAPVAPADAARTAAPDVAPAVVPDAAPAPAPDAAPASKPVAFTFDGDLQGWYLVEAKPATLTPTVRWSNAVGDPKPGSMELTIPFTGANQDASVEVVMTAGANLAGKTLSFRVRLASGLTGDATNPGSIRGFAKSGEAQIWAQGPSVSVPGAAQAGQWFTVTMGLSTPEWTDPKLAYDPRDVRSFGVQVLTGGAGSFKSALLNIDSVEVH